MQGGGGGDDAANLGIVDSEREEALRWAATADLSEVACRHPLGEQVSDARVAAYGVALFLHFSKPYGSQLTFLSALARAWSPDLLHDIPLSLTPPAPPPQTGAPSDLGASSSAHGSAAAPQVNASTRRPLSSLGSSQPSGATRSTAASAPKQQRGEDHQRHRGEEDGALLAELSDASGRVVSGLAEMPAAVVARLPLEGAGAPSPLAVAYVQAAIVVAGRLLAQSLQPHRTAHLLLDRIDTGVGGSAPSALLARSSLAPPPTVHDQTPHPPPPTPPSPFLSKRAAPRRPA